jgi:hypothetical protein
MIVLGKDVEYAVAFTNWRMAVTRCVSKGGILIVM